MFFPTGRISHCRLTAIRGALESANESPIPHPFRMSESPPASPKPKSAFIRILILFLVVLSIVAGFFTLQATREATITKAQRLQARVAMKGLEIAMKGYDIEYGELKGPATFGPRLGYSENADSVVEGRALKVLLGKDPELNSRQVRFFDPHSAKERKMGAWQDESGNWHFADPWGRPYRARVDANGDETIPDPEKPGASLKGTYHFYSSGPDGDPTTWHDNVTTWKD